MPSPTMPLRYEPSYDGLRAFAVAGVLAVHADLPLPGAGLGVEIFFVLSGYLITKILVAEYSRTGRIDLGRFYYRRTLRLMPALVAMVAVCAAWAAFHGRLEKQIFPSVMALSYLMNFNRAFAWGGQDLLGHTWSLAMEEQFYLLWPVVLLVVPPRKRIVTLIVLIVTICGWRGWLLLQGASIERVYNGFDTHSEVLLIGCLLAVCEPSIPAQVRQGAARLILLPMIGIALQVLLFSRQTSLSQGIGNISIGMFAAWLILALPTASWPRRLLSVASARFLGQISYGIYLWHFPLFQFGSELAIPHWRIIAPPVSILVAAISFYCIERPFLRMRKERDRRHRSA